jgi:hypothetical protein
VISLVMTTESAGFSYLNFFKMQIKNGCKCSRFGLGARYSLLNEMLCELSRELTRKLFVFNAMWLIGIGT